MVWFYLDDERGVPCGMDAILVPDYDSMIKIINMCQEYSIPFAIDFDYDIGDPYKSGYEVANYIVDNNIQMEGYSIHSSNKGGTELINSVLEKKFKKLG